MLTDNQKHAIVGVVLAAKRLWNANASQEQAAGTELIRAIEGLDHAMTHPEYSAPPPETEPPPPQPESQTQEQNPPVDPPPPADPNAAPQHVAQMQVP